MTTNNTTELYVKNFHRNLDIARSRQASIKQLVDEGTLVEGYHYGSFAKYGDRKTNDTRKSLYKPGAETILTGLGMSPDPVIMKDEMHIKDDSFRYGAEYVPYIEYIIRCDAYENTDVGRGGFRGGALGLCHSWETGRGWRWKWDNEVPKYLDTERLTKRTTRNKKVQYICPNNEVITDTNTILKMAFKRAYVALALMVGNCSDIFTQDLESLPNFTIVGKIDPTIKEGVLASELEEPWYNNKAMVNRMKEQAVTEVLPKYNLEWSDFLLHCKEESVGMSGFKQAADMIGYMERWAMTLNTENEVAFRIDNEPSPEVIGDENANNNQVE